MITPHKPQLSAYAKGFGGPVSGRKRITRTIVWLLLLSLVVNLFNTLLLPKTAQAVDANDFMFLFWTNCASPPSGWTVVSDGAGEAFYDAANGGLFPRGNSAYARNAGGALTHTHTATVTQTSVFGTSRGGSAGTTHDPAAHTHTGSASVNNISSLPSYKDICVIRYNSGIPTGDAAIPNGAIAIFDAAVPSGWNDYSATFGTYFVRGNSTSGGTGGSNTHQATGHTVSSIVLNAINSGTQTASGPKASSLTTHSHTVANQTSGTPDTQPPYQTIIFGQKSSNGPIPNGMIAMFEDTDSSVGFSVAGWTRLSDSGGPFYQRFLKVTGAYGSPSGATTHTHAVISTTSNSGGGSSSSAAAGSEVIEGHTHNLDITLANGTNTNIPPYTDVVIAKKQTVTTVLQTDQADYPGLGDIITVDSTVNNYHASTNLANTTIDYVIFIDADADGAPDAGETYITNNCAGSGAWASGNYTHQTTGVNVNASSSTNDQWQCANTNFPQITTYTLWARWWDNTSYAYNIYYEKSVTFTSVPTLGEIGFMAFVAGAVFFAVKAGFIKINNNNNSQANFLDSQLQNRGGKRKGETLPNQSSNSNSSQVSFLDFQLQNRGMKKRGETTPSQSSSSSNQNQESLIVTAPLGRIRDPKRLVDAITRSKNSNRQNNEQRP